MESFVDYEYKEVCATAYCYRSIDRGLVISMLQSVNFAIKIVEVPGFRIAPLGNFTKIDFELDSL